ncbi:ribbon-helix-helix domain-containing protein [Anaeromyxobacter oryzisoli]|jgi:Arc/MetJ-type ribon-helix-helix transcriptional regulator|uniref:ribbon-helix-helix domain-containing protein n=1 Tax=Anaeromyxobacter oryzisoli TaxID=2925408 RepID=UPI001F5A63D6|nr:ribbon-helix-helix domain-containing protein [Anaeromyxobacter sp. SG63]
MHPVDVITTVAQNPELSNRLEPMLVRLPRPLAAELRNLARSTRVRQSDYLREAVADLLAKYGRAPAGRTEM